jgi:hypothetical protein
MCARFGLCVTGCTLLAICAAAGRSRGQESHSPKQALLCEAPKKWEEYLVFSKRLQGRYTSRSFRLAPEKVFLGGEATEWKQGKDGSLVLAAAFDNHGIFAGERLTKASLLDPEFLREYPERIVLIRGSDKARHPEAYDRLAQRVQSLVAGGLHLHRALVPPPPLPDLFKDPGFSVTEAGTLAREGDPLYRVAFEYRPTQEANKAFARRVDGELYLEPRRYWLLAECHLAWKDPQPLSEEVRYEYKDAVAGYPLLCRRVTRAGQVQLEEDYLLHEQEDVPASEFTLAAYGLPEWHPVTVDATPTAEDTATWYVWAGVGLAVLVAFAVLLCTLSRRG